MCVHFNEEKFDKHDKRNRKACNCYAFAHFVEIRTFTSSHIRLTLKIDGGERRANSEQTTIIYIIFIEHIECRMQSLSKNLSQPSFALFA